VSQFFFGFECNDARFWRTAGHRNVLPGSIHSAMPQL
jgi:hypothetical protein